MVLQSPPASEQAVLQSADACYDRRRRLISALHDLKSSISSIEQQHPCLRDDLSSTCDKAILSLQDTEPLTESISDRSTAPKINPISLSLDKTATYIINGLDKMGDGIIFVFAKIGRVFG